MPNILADISQIKNRPGGTTAKNNIELWVNGSSKLAVRSVDVLLSATTTAPALTITAQTSTTGVLNGNGEGGELVIGAVPGYLSVAMDNYFGSPRFHGIQYNGLCRIISADGTTEIGLMGFVNQGFVTPTLGNGWVAFGGTNPTAGYYKDKFGIVHLRGVIRSGTTSTAIFTLPVGSRPVGGRMMFTVITGGNTPGRIDVDSSGIVSLSGGNNAFVSLDGIEFRTV